MTKKRQILVFIDWFLPGYKAGGQIPSVANIVNLLCREASFHIVTSDRDLGDTAPYPDIATNCWTEAYNARVMYLSPEASIWNHLRSIMKRQTFDTVYFNSFFSKRFTLIPLLFLKLFLRKRPEIILAPRGMLGKGALNIKKQKKRLFIAIAKRSGLYRGLHWHASSEMEAKEITDIFGRGSRVSIASDISAIEDTAPQKPKKESGTAKFFYLSRITPKKNLLFALRLLEQLPEKHKAEYHIIGPSDDLSYEAECQKIIEKIRPGITIIRHGEKPPSAIKKLLPAFHYMLFPTTNENYGHVVAEALIAGCPVILSDQTPWQNLTQAGAGWTIPLDRKEDYLETIVKCIEAGDAQYQEWSRQAYLFGLAAINSPLIKQANRNLFIPADTGV